MYRKNTILLFGLGGTGKTVACISLLKLPGMKVRMLITDSNSMSGIKKGLEIHKVTPKEGDLVLMCPLISNDNTKAFKQAVIDRTNYLRNSTEENYKAKVGTNERIKYQKFLDVQKGVETFKGIDYATGKEINLGNIGDYSQWDENTCLCIDGLTTVSDAVTQEVLCGRPNLQLSDYGDIQNALRVFISQLNTLTKCTIVVLGHAKISENELNSQESISVAIPGKELAGTISGYFANTIYCELINGKRVWHGIAKGRKINLSVRDIPEEENLIPDFSLEKYTFFN